MLTLHIDNAWEPNDFIEVLQSVESMYYKLNVKRRYKSLYRYPFLLDSAFLIEGDLPSERSYGETLDRINRAITERARFDSISPEKLLVHRIQYASPGGIDLLGLGKACESIANAIGRMVVYYNDRHLRQEKSKQASLETESLRIDLEKDHETLRALKIKNARDMLELERDFPEEASEILLPLLVRDQDILSERIADGRLIGAETNKQS